MSQYDDFVLLLSAKVAKKRKVYNEFQSKFMLGLIGYWNDGVKEKNPGFPIKLRMTAK